MDPENSWWRRSQGAWVIYAIGAVLALVALVLPFYEEGWLASESYPGWEVAFMMGDWLVRGATPVTGSGRLRAYLAENVPVGGLVLNYLLLLPGFLGLWLGAQSRLALWLARGLWSVALLIGPVLLLVLASLQVTWHSLVSAGGPGFWLWIISMPVMTAAFWALAAPARPAGGDTGVPSVTRAGED